MVQLRVHGKSNRVACSWGGEMISVKRLADSGGKQFYSVESRLPDGKLQCMTRHFKFMCNARGFEDEDARTKALRFVITTDTLRHFRAFIFSDVDDAPVNSESSEGPLQSTRTLFETHVPAGSHQFTTRRIRSYVCLRQNWLNGLRFAVAISKLENGHLRAVSFQDQSLSGLAITGEALNQALQFLRGVSFESWRKESMKELSIRDQQEAIGLRRERALKHLSAFVEIEGGEKVDCVCGKNRSRGLMVACERCEAWEHAECRGFRSNKQIPTKYICSACIRAEREDVVIITLDEQGECGTLQPEDLWTDSKLQDCEGNGVCCICGCEDNQDFETMIPPESEHVCDGGMALAHPSCISAAQRPTHKAWNLKAVAAGMCHFCGGRFVKSLKGNEDVHSQTSSGLVSETSMGSISPNQYPNSRTPDLDWSARGAKRLRSALSNGVFTRQDAVDKHPATTGKVDKSDVRAVQSGKSLDLASTEASKQTGEIHVDRRFREAAVTVPIKKRRLLMAAVRSPSPLRPSSSSPAPEMDDSLVSSREPMIGEVVKKREGDLMVEIVEGGQKEFVSTLVSSEDPDGKDSTITEVPVTEESPVQMESVMNLNSSFTDGGRGAQVSGVPHLVNVMSATTIDETKECNNYTSDLMLQADARPRSEPTKMMTSADMNEQGGRKGKEHDEVSVLGKIGEVAGISIPTLGPSRDARLHWDLNMDMEEWDRPLEEDSGTFLASDGDLVPKANRADEETVSHESKGSEAAVKSRVSDLVIQLVHASHSESDAFIRNVGVNGDTLADGACVLETKGMSLAVEQSGEDCSDLLETERVDYGDSDSRNGDEVGSEGEEHFERDQKDNICQCPLDGLHGVRRVVSNEAVIAEWTNQGAGCNPGPSGGLSKNLIEERETSGSTDADADADYESTELTSHNLKATGLDCLRAQDASQKRSQERSIIFSGTRGAHSTEKSDFVSETMYQPAVSKKISFPRSSARQSEEQTRTKLSGWDQLPDELHRMQEALQASADLPAGRNGRGSSWGRGKTPQDNSVTGTFGRTLSAGGGRDKAIIEDSWTREEDLYVPRGERCETSSGVASSRVLERDSGANRRGMSSALHASVCMETWKGNSCGLTSPWVSRRHRQLPERYSDGIGRCSPTNAAARALLKVESSGFVVAPDGTLTKAKSSACGPLRPVQSEGPNASRGMSNVARGPAMNWGVGMNIRGLQMSMKMKREMSLRMGASRGISVKVGAGVGPDVRVRELGRSGLRGREAVHRFSNSGECRTLGSAPVVGLTYFRAADRSQTEYKDRWSRRENASASPRKRSTSRSRSYTPRSKSETKSPRARISPRVADVSVSSGDAQAISSTKIVRSAATSFTGDANFENAESPRQPVLLPAMLHPVPPPRSQRCPPTDFKRLNANRKDPSQALSKDREREWTCTSSRRTSPHVVHGSALMDERDRKLLAGVRHVSPNVRHILFESPAVRTVVPDASPSSLPFGKEHISSRNTARRKLGDRYLESKIRDYRRNSIRYSPEQIGRERFGVKMGYIAKKDGVRDMDDDQRDRSKSINNSVDKEGRVSGSGLKYSRDGDDDVAPRRKRPSP